jgi:hypothetical protein
MSMDKRELDCTDVAALAAGFIDDEIDAETRHAAERHLVTCRACRDAIGAAESAMQLVAAETAASIAGAALPEGFVGAVLSRTVYEQAAPARRVARGPGRTTAWLGWVVAAAALALAATAWLAGPGAGSDAPAAMLATLDAPGAAGSVPPYMRSEVRPDDGTGAPRAPVVTFGPPEGYFDGVAVSVPKRTLPRAIPRRDDAEAIESTMWMFEMLRAARADDGSAIERVRSIAAYDELLARLAVAKDRLDPADRPLVLSAESLVHRVVSGPVDGATVEDLHKAIDDLDLVERLGEIVRRRNDAMAL